MFNTDVSISPEHNARSVPPQSPSANNIAQGNSKNNGKTGETTTEVTRSEKDIEMPRLETTEQSTLHKDTELPGSSHVSAEGEGYLDALARDDNEPGERMTEKDYAKYAEDARLKKMEVPPESQKEPVSQADLDELWKLWEDEATPVTDSNEQQYHAGAVLAVQGIHQRDYRRYRCGREDHQRVKESKGHGGNQRTGHHERSKNGALLCPRVQ